MKAFVAVIPPLYVREAIAKFRHVTQPIEKMHVTLHFIGTVTKASLKILTEKFITLQAMQVCSIIYGAGAFNNKDGSAYLKVGPHPEWVALHEKVVATFDHPVRGGYTPHLTVATFRGEPVPESVISSLNLDGLNKQLLFHADKISLLTSENGIYKIVNTVWLRKR